MAISTLRLANARRTLLSVALCAAMGPLTGFTCLAAPQTGRPPSSANLLSVTNCLDDGSPGTLRSTIAAAADGDTVDLNGLDCSVITLHSGSLAAQVPHLTIRGPGADALTIDGSNAFRVLTGVNLDISGLTIAHGLDTTGSGGACVRTEYDLSLTDAALTSCVMFAVNGSAVGGAAVVLGNLAMYRSSITSSTVSGADSATGGGAAVAGAATIYASVISGNHARASLGSARGGGIVATGTVTLHASLISDNSAESTSDAAYGGGILSHDGDVLVLDGSTISGNVASSESGLSFGGGIDAGGTSSSASSVQVENSTITGNEASSDCATCLVRGGGIHAYNSIKAKYSTVADNRATCTVTASTCTAKGGGLAVAGNQSESVVFLLNSTISSNDALGGSQFGGLGIGGGVWIGADKPFLCDNSTVTLNSASTLGGGVAGSSPSSAPSTARSSLFSNNDAAGAPNDVGAALIGAPFVINGGHDLVMASSPSVTLPNGTLTSDPHLLPLTTLEGGTTPLHPLPSNSVAVDAGSNENALQCDQRGFPYVRVRGGAADIGAYEVQGEAHLFFSSFETSPLCEAAAP